MNVRLVNRSLVGFSCFAPARCGVLAGCCAIALFCAACSAETEPIEQSGNAAKSSSAADENGGADGNAGGGFSGGAAGGSAGTGGTIEYNDAGDILFSDPDAGVCSSIGQTAENKIQPADIIIAVDQSTSMDLEAQWAQQQLNDFANLITTAGIDAHVVLIASRVSGNVMCVPPPLAGPNCADNLPIFFQVDDEVHSHDALVKITQHVAAYSHILRPDASKHFVVITDDESTDMTAAAFDAQIRAADPALFESYVFHAIYSFMDPITSCLIGNLCCAVSAAPGLVYEQLVTQTGGVAGDLCVQDFMPVWNAVAATVIEGSTLACEWDIPPPPEGEIFDADLVNVRFSTAGGPETIIGFVQTVDDCVRAGDGWFYDNNDNPTRILFCPETCQRIQGLLDAKVDIEFGCKKIMAPLE
jgi:hypothetical protein